MYIRLGSFWSDEEDEEDGGAGKRADNAEVGDDDEDDDEGLLSSAGSEEGLLTRGVATDVFVRGFEWGGGDRVGSWIMGADVRKAEVVGMG